METVNMDYLATGQIEAEDVRELVWRQECRDNPGRAISGNRMDGLVISQKENGFRVQTSSSSGFWIETQRSLIAVS